MGGGRLKKKKKEGMQKLVLTLRKNLKGSDWFRGGNYNTRGGNRSKGKQMTFQTRIIGLCQKKGKEGGGGRNRGKKRIRSSIVFGDIQTFKDPRGLGTKENVNLGKKRVRGNRINRNEGS